MRIISGKLKGRQLVAFKGRHIRPTTDRVKETIFNKIRFELDDAKVLDLFSGTGNLSIESFSQGAVSVDSVEKNPKSIKIMRSNLQKLGIIGGSDSGINIIAKDVFVFLKGFKGEPYEIIFIDPPFTEKWADRVLKSVSQSHVLQDGSLVIIEAMAQENVKEQYGNLEQSSKTLFGDKVLYFFRNNNIGKNKEEKTEES